MEMNFHYKDEANGADQKSSGFNITRSEQRPRPRTFAEAPHQPRMQGQPIASGEDELFENASRIVESEVVTLGDQARFFRQGLLLSNREIQRLEDQIPSTRVMTAIDRWRQKHPNYGLTELVQACERCELNAIAQQISIN